MPENIRDPAAAPAAVASSRPPALTPFVGRDQPAALLLDAVRHAGPYGSRVAVVVGERGIGKTRLAAEVAKRVEEDGARVIWGRAWWEAGRAARLWPWIQALRSLAARLPHLARRHRAVLDRLASVAADEKCPASAPPPFELFADVVSLLETASARRPLLVILDDLHLADADSLALLQFVSRDIGTGHFVVLGTCREELGLRGRELAAALGALDQRTRYLTLAPLEKDDVRSYLRLVGAAEPPAPLVERVFERCGGNAFFLAKIAALYSSGGDDGVSPTALPPGVREEVIGYRLAGVSEDCRELLQVAAVLGCEFRVEMLERMLSEVTWAGEANLHARVLAVLNEALGTGLIRQDPRKTPGRYAFAYSLVRDALYQHLPVLERSRVHRAAGSALATAGHSGRAEDLEELAGHFENAGAAETMEQAAICAADAAAVHASNRCYGRAIQLYERALADLDCAMPAGGAAEGRRAEWLLQLAAARRLAGNRQGAREAARSAAVVARALARRDGHAAAHLLIKAAVEQSTGRPWSRTGIVDEDIIQLLQEALDLLPAGDGALRAHALAQVAGQFHYSQFDSGAWRDDVSREAVAMARRVGDAESLAHALERRHFATWFAGNLDERAQMSSELVTVARHLPDLDLRAQGHLLRALDLLESGELVEMGRELVFCREVAGERGVDRFAWHVEVIRATHAAFEGRLLEAEQLAQQALDLGQREQPEDAGVFFGVQLYTIRRLQGRFEELLPLARAFADQFPTIPIWRVGVADLFAQLGREAEASAAFEYFAAPDFTEPPADWNWLLALALLSEVCAFLGDRPRAAALYERLLPCAGQNVVAVPGLACIGPAAYQLGLLAATLERWADAARHFEHALRRNLEQGGLPYAAHAQRQHAAMSLRQWEKEPSKVDLGQAAKRLADCTATYVRLGMDAYAARARQLASRLAEVQQPARSGGAVGPATPRSENELRWDGNRWQVIWQGRRAAFRNLAGIGYIAYLISCAPRAVHVAELESASASRRSVQPWPAGDRRLLGADQLSVRQAPAASAVLDARARSELASRLKTIDTDLAEAEAHHDLGRIATLRAERDALTRAIVGAFRRLDTDDKQRKRVWRAIRTIAIPAVGAEFPDLAEHLSASIFTGTFCRYEPSSPVAWVVDRQVAKSRET